MISMGEKNSFLISISIRSHRRRQHQEQSIIAWQLKVKNTVQGSDVREKK